jgi:Cellulose binding domain
MKKNIILTTLALLVLISTSLSCFFLYSSISPKAQPVAIFNKFTYGVSVEQQDINNNIPLVAGPWLMAGNQNVVYDFLDKFSQPQNSSKVPYVYMYIAAGSARQDWGLQDCNVGASEDKTLCSNGANYLRSNYQKVAQQYRQYALGIKNTFGSNKPIILHVEPDFYQYSYNSQYNGGISFDEAARAMNSWTDTIRQILPNASLVLDVSPWNSDLRSWSAGMRNFDYAGIVGKRFSPNGDGSVSAGVDGKTYSYISQVTGKKLILNDSHGVGGWYLDYDYAWHEKHLIEARWNDGVVAVIQPPSDIGALSWAVDYYSQNPIPASYIKSSSVIKSSSSSSIIPVSSSISSKSISKVSSTSTTPNSQNSTNNVSSKSTTVVSIKNIGGFAKSIVADDSQSVCTQNSAELTLKKESAWAGGYTAKLLIKNKSSEPITNWQINTAFTPNQKFTKSWNFQTQTVGKNIRLSPVAEWNRIIQPNQEYEVGGFSPETDGNNTLPQFDCNVSR